MQLTNSKNSYGWITIILHWTMAIMIIGLYLLGDYMVGLDYYDNYYHKAPWVHKSLGLILCFLLVFRWGWKIITPQPQALQSLKKIEIKFSKWVHLFLYLLILVCCVSGYLISTSKGVGITVFDWFELPSILTLNTEQTDIAAKIHELTTLALVILAGLHALAGLKHQFINKNNILKRIIKPIKEDS